VINLGHMGQQRGAVPLDALPLTPASWTTPRCQRRRIPPPGARRRADCRPERAAGQRCGAGADALFATYADVRGERLGHSTASIITLDSYSHMPPSIPREALNVKALIMN
jgi:hypothetical protein